MSTAGLVKCVVWDLDNTLLRGTYLESLPDRPPADPGLASVAAELGRRGIVHAIATRNPPEAAEYAAQATGCVFVAAECGWGRKSEALARIAAGLDISVDTLAFVDDDPYERAEVGAALPGVRVLSPEDAAEAVGWPEFSPADVTEEARHRAGLYRQRHRRQQAEQAFAGTHEDFLRACQTEVTIAAAGPADVPRLHELSERTSQFNSAGHGLPAESLRALLGAPDTDVMTVRLRDRFADDGLVGGCVIDRRQDREWTVPLLMMSCRAIGRGVIDSLLTWLSGRAAGQGAAAVQVPCPVSERSVPLRLALARAGFRAAADQAAGPGRPVSGRIVFRSDLGAPRPALPDWVTVPGEA